MTRVALLAGGVGGAKLAEGFAGLPDVDLSVIGNVADDEEFHGLWVSPDIDTMLYTLSGRVNRDQGWGVDDEGRRALDTLAELGAPDWMFLGDRDFGLHIYRTARLKAGDRPSDIVADIVRAFGVKAQIILPTDDRVQTRVETDQGWLSFQEYFVRDRCAPKVLDLSYSGLPKAQATPEALGTISGADLIVIAPSNPLVSILPIVSIPGVTAALQSANTCVLAVSPLIAGQAVKGPATSMMTSLGHRADALGVAEIYRDFVSSMLIDEADQGLAPQIAELGIKPIVADIMMRDAAGKTRLASEILDIWEASRGIE